MAGKKLRESTCRHAHCGEPIFYSDFTECWLHWSTAGAPCPKNTMAEPADDPPASNYSAQFGTGSLG